MATVIVALPAADEKVYQISSEKVPHLTLLYLDDSVANMANLVQYVEHAAKLLDPFGLTVDYRGTLGPDQADVLFFEKNNLWDIDGVKRFRHHLLLDDNVKRAYDNADQFPEWVPHLTLGYPDAPAKEDTDEYKGIRWVQFDRVAVWEDDYEGPEFRLKYDRTALEGDVAIMSDTTPGVLIGTVLEKHGDLKQYGVKGMRWGVRKDVKTSVGGADKGPTSVVVTQKKPGTYAKTKGGKRLPMSEDAFKALEGRQKAKASTTDALSNAELRQVVERMQLEQRYSQLAFESDRRSRGARWVSGFLGMKRYNGEKRRYSDMHEDQGEYARKAADAVREVLKEKAGA